MIKKLTMFFISKFNLCILLEIIDAILVASITYFMVDVTGVIVDDMVAGQLKNIWFYINNYILITVVGVLLTPLIDYNVNKVLVNVGVEFDMFVYKLFMKQKYSVVDKYSKGDLFKRLCHEAISFRLDLFSVITTFISRVIIISVIICRLSIINILLTIILLVMSLIVVLVPMFTSKLSTKYITIDKEKQAAKTNFNMQLINHKEYVRVNNFQSKLANKLGVLIEERLMAFNRFLKFDKILKTITSYLIFLVQVFFLLIGSLFIANEYISTGEFVLFFGSGYLLNYSVGVLARRIQNTLPNFRASAKRLSQILENEEDKDLELIDEINSIEFRNVDFAYGDENVLSNISFTIDRVTTTRIEGQNGSGKSTIIKLLMKLYKPSDGRILINGKDINTLCQNCIRDKIGFVIQDPVLFNMSVLDNIKLGSNKNPDELLKLLGLETIKDVIVNESSKNISGGQRKKISLAREFMKKRDIIVIDELRNFLDNDIYQKVITYIKGLDTTLILISHDDEQFEIDNSIKL